MYFEGFAVPSWSKRSAVPVSRHFQRTAQLKRERGEFFIHPAVAPVSLYAIIPFVISPTDLHLGGQNLAALCTAAGQNLAAVGSSHSLTETVDLGTMTTAGLVGTLHVGYTSLDFDVSYARQPVTGRSNT